MVSFEEQFPSLDFRTGFNPFCPSEKLLLQENCLDKQRVKEVFNKHRYCGLVCENRFNEKTSNGNCVDNILEELEIKHNYNLGYPARKIEPLSQNQYLDLKEILGL